MPRIPSASASANKRPSRIPITCDICHVTLSQKSDMGRHMKTHDQNVDTLKLACEYPGCKYKTLQKSNMTVHMRIHTGETLKCPDCDFESKDSLTRHRKEVHGYIPKARAQRAKPRRRCLDGEVSSATSPSDSEYSNFPSTPELIASASTASASNQDQDMTTIWDAEKLCPLNDAALFDFNIDLCNLALPAVGCMHSFSNAPLLSTTCFHRVLQECAANAGSSQLHFDLPDSFDLGLGSTYPDNLSFINNVASSLSVPNPVATYKNALSFDEIAPVPTYNLDASLYMPQFAPTPDLDFDRLLDAHLDYNLLGF